MSKGHTAVNLFLEDKTRYADFFNENFFSRKADCFRHVDGETYRAIGELLQSKQILEKSVSKEEMECEKDMCKALEDLYQHGKRDGEDKKLREQVEKKLKKGFKISEIAEMLEEDEDTISRIVQSIITGRREAWVVP